MSTNFNIIQGDKWSLDIAYTTEDNQPINISNYTIIAEVRNKPGGNIICATITTGDGITMVDDGNYNRFIMTFTGEKTSKFTYPRAAYQVKIQDTEDTLLDGWLEVNAGVVN